MTGRAAGSDGTGGAPARRHPHATIDGSRYVHDSQAGQATVELVALLPLLALVAFAVYAVSASYAARELASQASEAGAVALLQDADAQAAARRAIPPHLRRSSRIQIAGRRVTVQVRPDLPLRELEDVLTASITADAGPEPR